MDSFFAGMKKSQPVQKYLDKGKNNVLNPFMLGSYIEVLRLEGTTKTKEDNFGEGDIKVRESQEYVSVEVKRPYLVDKQHSTKVYHSPELDFIIYSLNGTALKLLAIIIGHVSKNSDRVRINYQSFMVTAGVSKVTYYSAIQKLIDFNVIANYKQGIYWINPHLFFNGSRIEKYKDRIKEVRVVKDFKKPK